jgi:hypothetical protein
MDLSLSMFLQEVMALSVLAATQAGRTGGSVPISDACTRLLTAIFTGLSMLWIAVARAPRNKCSHVAGSSGLRTWIRNHDQKGDLVSRNARSSGHAKERLDRRGGYLVPRLRAGCRVAGQNIAG